MWEIQRGVLEYSTVECWEGAKEEQDAVTNLLPVRGVRKPRCSKFTGIGGPRWHP